MENRASHESGVYKFDTKNRTGVELIDDSSKGPCWEIPVPEVAHSENGKLPESSDKGSGERG